MEKEYNDLINKLKALPQPPFPEWKKKQILSAMKETKPTFFPHIKIVGLSLMTLLIAIILVTIKIEKGQVYIDGKKLVSFYGNEYHTGIYVENSEVQSEEIELAEDEFFVLGDNWWRSIDSKLFGPVHKESIIGKVTGILD